MKIIYRYPILLLVFFLMLLVPAAGMSEEEISGPLFPVLYSKNPERELEIVATRFFSKTDEGRHLSSQVPGQPFGPSTRELLRFKSKPDKGPLYLVIDYAGMQKFVPERPEIIRYVILNLAVECPEIQGDCYRAGPNTWNQKLFHVDGEMQGGTPVREMNIDGRKAKLMLGHDLYQYQFAQDTPVVFYLSLTVPEHIETHQLRMTFLYGEPTTIKPPRGPLRAGSNGSVIAGTLLLILVVLWARNASKLESGDYQDSPKLMGILLTLLGLALAFGGVSIDLLYFVVIGFMMAMSGCLLFFGRAAAIWFYGITLATVWIWSGLEVGPNILPVLKQVTLPSLIGLYLYFSSIPDRLRN